MPDGLVSTVQEWIIPAASGIMSGFSFLFAYHAHKQSKEDAKKYDLEISTLKDQLATNQILMHNHAHDSLHKTAMDINYQLLNYNVDLPVLHDIFVPEERKEEVRRKTILFLHQLNLFYLAYLYQDAVGQGVVDSQKKWMSQTVKPWMRDDPCLRQLVMRIRGGKDLYQRGFVDWIAEIFADVH